MNDSLLLAGIIFTLTPMLWMVLQLALSDYHQVKRLKIRDYVRSTHYWGEQSNVLKHCMFCAISKSHLEHRMKSDVEKLNDLRCTRLERQHETR